MKSTLMSFLILLGVFFGCIAPDKQNRANYNSDSIHRLDDLFTVYVSDIQKARHIVAEKQLLENLGHLLKITKGDKKYYLLEQEAINEMLRSVTVGLYSDIILINHKGIVIYTMNEDDIFGKNVNDSLKHTALSRCFKNKGSDVYFEDITEFPMNSDGYNLFVSTGIFKKKEIIGVLILRISSIKIGRLLGEKTEVIDFQGIYKICSDQSKILKPFPYFSVIKVRSDKEFYKPVQFTEGKFSAVNYSFKNLSWIVITYL